MHSLQKRFQDFILTHNLLSGDDHALLAVSGGVDSMVLFDLFSAANYKFSVAHCNYGLRGDDSDKDEVWVREACEKNGIEFHSKKIKLSGSIQVEARNQRYQWFNELAREYGYSKICTAHHLDDSFETTLFNLVRGTGIKGLKGVARENGLLIRPLLFAAKHEILDYAKNSGLKWREDISNQKADYDRNKLRIEVVPRLKEINTSLLKTYASTSERLEFTSQFMLDYCEKIKREFFDTERSELGLQWISKPSDLIILAEILSEYGVNYPTAKEVYESIGDSGKTFPGNEFVIYMDRDSLLLRENSSTDIVRMEIDKEGDYQVGRHCFTVEKCDREKVQLGNNEEIALLDAESINFPLTIRGWKDGDVFIPLGMKGRKKVSDFLIDAKVPLALKNELLIIEDQEKIVWIVGMRISEECKILESTEVVIKIKRT